MTIELGENLSFLLTIIASFLGVALILYVLEKEW